MKADWSERATRTLLRRCTGSLGLAGKADTPGCYEGNTTVTENKALPFAGHTRK
jgi:hypothetical protein